jgi:hypothetical protein
MAEEVQTGGLKIFRNSEEQPELDSKRKADIEEAYEAYYERKKEEKHKRRMLLIIGIIVLLLILIAGICIVIS